MDLLFWSVVMVGLVDDAKACSYFEVRSPDDVWVIGRTMELGTSGGSSGEMNQWNVVLHPRGQDATFTNRYGYIGLDSSIFPNWTSTDGMNEAGLTISAHTMRMAEYEVANPDKTVLSVYDLIPWVLGQFDSVAAVEHALTHVSVVSATATREDFMHWALADARGNSAVLEYVGGKRMFHANDVRVMTNDPDYTWHLKNLNMYVALTPHPPVANTNIEIRTEVGAVPQIWSQGFNLAALPGDFSPAARFIRLFYLRGFAALQSPVTSVDEAIVLATGLLNNVFIPRGTVAPIAPQAFSASGFDFTQYALLKIPAQNRLLFRSYRDMTWKQVDLTKLDWSRARSIPVSDGTLGIRDVTQDIEGSSFEYL